MTNATLHPCCCFFSCFSRTTHDHLAVIANNLKWFISQNMTHTSCALWFSSPPPSFFFFCRHSWDPREHQILQSFGNCRFQRKPPIQVSVRETDHNCVHHYCSAEKLKCSVSWSFLILLISWYDICSELHSTQTVPISSWFNFLGQISVRITNIFPGIHVIFDQIKISRQNSCLSLGCETGVIL